MVADVVVDTSALLAMLNAEPGAAFVADEEADKIVIVTVYVFYFGRLP